jgi:serine/threonine protein phosphatase 1
MPDWLEKLRTHALASRPVRTVGAGQRVYAIGDIHGCLSELRALKAMIAADNAGRTAATVKLIYLGDYIDRGPDSMGVLDEVRSPLDGVATIYLKGNHEVMLEQFIADPVLARDWLRNGGLETLASFGVDGRMANLGIDLEGLRDALVTSFGPDRSAWLPTLRLQVRFGDYFFCHAGVRPGIPLDEQKDVDLLWIRYPFLSSRRDFGAVVVHGHTPGAEPELRRNRINLDTACFATGRLTAAVFDGDATVTFLSTSPAAGSSNPAGKGLVT